MPYSEMVFVEGNKDIDDFYIGKYLVTQAIWVRVMGKEANKSRFKSEHRPVETVSWDTITQIFLPKLRKREGKEYTLPSETVWEYAAKGGKYSKNYKYAGSNDLNEVGWYNENSHRESKPVGLKSPNELGLYDLSGNLWEWCSDKWKDDSESRVIWGGSWFNDQRGCRPSYCYCFRSDTAYSDAGFRLVCSFTSQR